MLALNSSRQPFDGITEPKQIDLKSYRIRGQGKCPPIANLLIVGCSLGLFIYVNIYFLIQVSYLVDGSIYNKTTQTFSCNSYYCDQTAYNFINYYSNYVQCNKRNCQDIICSNYQCNNDNYIVQDINYYYACQNICGPISQSPVPNVVKVAYILAICSACCLGTAILLGMAYGIIAGCCTKGLSPL